MTEIEFVPEFSMTQITLKLSTTQLRKQQNKTPKEEEAFNSTQWWYFENYCGSGVECPGVIMVITPGKKFLVIPSIIFNKTHCKELST